MVAFALVLVLAVPLARFYVYYFWPLRSQSQLASRAAAEVLRQSIRLKSIPAR